MTTLVAQIVPPAPPPPWLGAVVARLHDPQRFAVVLPSILVTPPKLLGKAARACEVKDCSRPYYGRGYCSLHYQRVQRTGRPELHRRDDAYYRLEAELWARDLAGDPSARQELIERRVPYAAVCARRFALQRGCVEHLEDLRSVATLAVVSCTMRFHPARCNQPSSAYALAVAQEIRRDLKQYAAHNLYALGVSHTTDARIAEVAKIAQDLRQELYREPTVEEVAARTRFRPASTLRYMQKANEGRPVDAHEWLAEWEGYADDATPDALALVAEVEQSRQVVVKKALRLMKPRERGIVIRRFGLDGEEPQTSKQQTAHPTAARTLRRKQQSAIERTGQLLRVAAV